MSNRNGRTSRSLLTFGRAHADSMTRLKATSTYFSFAGCNVFSQGDDLTIDIQWFRMTQSSGSHIADYIIHGRGDRLML